MAQDKNRYVAVPTLTKEAAIFSDEQDERDIIETTNRPSFFSRIGQLRMNFEANNKTISFNGTASVFYVDKNTNKVYAVTCAHNLKYFDPLKSKANVCIDSIFERRKTIGKGSSKSMKEYKVCHEWVHPNYDPSTAVSSNDLAIIAFQDDDKYFENLEKEMNDLDEKLEIEDYTHIYGYPVSKKGELWGQSKKADVTHNENTNLLQYDIQTTGGQSGSPIIRFTQNTEKTISDKMLGSILMAVSVIMMKIGYSLGFASSSSFDLAVLFVIITFIVILYYNNKLITKQCNIVGIHTTGNDTGNIGIKLTDKSLKWIKEQIKVEETTKDSFYCLKATPFI